MDLNNRHVLVTGASRGIGAAVAEAMAAKGARLTVVARSAAGLADVAGRIGGRASWRPSSATGGMSASRGASSPSRRHRRRRGG